LSDPYLKRALELAERGRRTTHPNPPVGAVVVSPGGGSILGEGWHERAGEPHAEVHALRAAGGRARGATLYVTLEPCAQWGRTPPCVDAIVEAGIAKVVVGVEDPAEDGVERLRKAGIEVEVVNDWDARVLTEAWRWWVEHGRPFVTYKVAATLDGRVTIPAERWVSGEEARRSVHELRAGSDAVAVGMGTVRADNPKLDARDVTVIRQPRRLAFGLGPLPPGSTLELRSGALEEELRALGEEDVQSLLLEGGPTLATAFLERDLIDKLLVYLAPRLAGAGPRLLGDFTPPRRLRHVNVRSSGEDVLVEAYLHGP
jgi:diaminohydroxyphosphoribosylaminopyrimidine deaminase / 5-amino-6-(5-phosphoribosylamino)uracil reductase